MPLGFLVLKFGSGYVYVHIRMNVTFSILNFSVLCFVCSRRQFAVQRRRHRSYQSLWSYRPICVYVSSSFKTHAVSRYDSSFFVSNNSHLRL